MSKPTEQRYPSGPAKVGEQKPGGQSSNQPLYKANPAIKPDRVQGPPTEAVKPPLRAAKDAMPQEPKKS